MRGNVSRPTLRTLHCLVASFGVVLFVVAIVFGTIPAAKIMKNASPTFNTASIALCVLAALTTAAGIFGALVAHRYNETALRVSFLMTALFMFAKFGGFSWFICAEWPYLESTVSSAMNETVRSAYGGDREVTLALDEIQRSNECCGFENYMDWALSSFNGIGKPPLELQLKNTGPTYRVPQSCCSLPDSAICKVPIARRVHPLSKSQSDVFFSNGCQGKVGGDMKPWFYSLFVIWCLVGLVETFAMLASLQVIETSFPRQKHFNWVSR